MKYTHKRRHNKLQRCVKPIITTVDDGAFLGQCFYPVYWHKLQDEGRLDVLSGAGHPVDVNEVFLAAASGSNKTVPCHFIYFSNKFISGLPGG